MSTFEDCQKFLNFVVECFVEKPVTVNQLKIEKLRTAAAPCYRITEAHPIKITDREETEVDKKEKPSDASLRVCGHRNVYTLTNIYIYPIKSCAAFEVWWIPHCFSVTVYLVYTWQTNKVWGYVFLLLRLVCFIISLLLANKWESSYRPMKIVRCVLKVTIFLMLCCSCRFVSGLWDLMVYYMTEAGWWWTKTVFASVKRECHVCVSFNLKSICLLTNCCCGHQVRSCFSRLLKNTQQACFFTSFSLLSHRNGCYFNSP